MVMYWTETMGSTLMCNLSPHSGLYAVLHQGLGLYTNLEEELSAKYERCQDLLLESDFVLEEMDAFHSVWSREYDTYIVCLSMHIQRTKTDMRVTIHSTSDEEDIIILDPLTLHHYW